MRKQQTLVNSDNNLPIKLQTHCLVNATLTPVLPITGATSKFYSCKKRLLFKKKLWYFIYVHA